VAKTKGWFSVHRSLTDSEFWLSEKFTRPQAWVDLLALANHKDSWYRCRGIRVEVKRGQVGYSETSLAERWKWSRTKVRAFLDELEKEQQIKHQKTNVTTLITIVNYHHYQEISTAKRTPEKHQKDTNNNDNNDNNDIKEKVNASVTILPEVPDLDHAAWTAYVNYRKEAKFKKLTKKGEVLAAKKIISFAVGCTQMDIVEQSISNGWQGLFEFKGNQQRGNYDNRNRAERTLDAIRNLPDN